MKGYTHLVAGLASAITISYLTGTHTWEIALGGLLGGILPDIDHPKSTISSKTGLHLFLKHRGLTHSLTFLLFLCALFPLVINYINTQFYIGLLAGTASHIFLDWLTPGGVQLFYPFSAHYSCPILSWIKNFFKILISLVLLIGIIAYLYYTHR